MNLLVLSVSRKVQLIKSLKNSCKSHSRKLFCADSSNESPALYFGDEFVIVPKISGNNLLNYLLDYCKCNNITFILPTSDHDMVFLVDVRDVLEENGITVLMSDPTTVSKCLSKFKFAKICANNNLPVPQQYYSLDDLEYPCVGKLDISQASKGVFFIETPEDLTELLKKYNFSDFIFQKYINFPEYTIDSFYGSNGELICAVPRERLKVVNGESIVSKTVYIPELTDLAEKLSLVFDFLGHVTIQAFFNGTQVFLVEINPRFGGASNLSFNAGLNSPEWTLHLIGKHYKLIKAGDIRYNLKMLRYSQDFFV